MEATLGSSVIFANMVGQYDSTLPPAALMTAELSTAAQSELLMMYSAMILHDEGSDLSAENLSAVIKAAGGKVESYWPTMFAKMMKGKDFGDQIKKAGTPGSGGGGGGAAPAAGGAAAG